MDEYIFLLNKHRERFQAWCLVISSLALIAAIWTRAPNLEVDIPLFAGAKASINAGYVISIAPTFIAVSMCWAVGSLLSMRSYQVSLIKSKKKFDLWQKVAINGPLNQESTKGINNDRIFVFIQKSVKKTREFFYFVVPVVSQVVIMSTMFSDLAFYDKNEFLKKVHDPVSGGLEAAADFSPQDVKDFGYWTFFSKDTVKKGVDYTLSFNDLNVNCGLYFYLEDLNTRINSLSDTEKLNRNHLLQSNPSCASLGFPNFKLAMNTWANLIMLAITIIVSFYGSLMYSSRNLLK